MPCRNPMHGRGPLCRRDAAAGSLHSGHSSAWPPRSPRLMGIHVGSSPSPWHPGCRQELPALFPAFAAKRPPAPCECPAPASAGTSPTPTALEGLRNGAGVAFAPPQPHTGAGAAWAQGWGWCWVPPPCCRRWAPLCVGGFAGTAQERGVGLGGGVVCTPLLAVAPSWGGEPGPGLPVRRQPGGQPLQMVAARLAWAWQPLTHRRGSP